MLTTTDFDFYSLGDKIYRLQGLQQLFGDRKRAIYESIRSSQLISNTIVSGIVALNRIMTPATAYENDDDKLLPEVANYIKRVLVALYPIYAL